MADVERIAPPVPTLPPPVGRGVGERRRRDPQRDRPPAVPAPDRPDSEPKPDHIDEYV
jgi:hypothetical protein